MRFYHLGKEATRRSSCSTDYRFTAERVPSWPDDTLTIHMSKNLRYGTAMGFYINGKPTFISKEELAKL